MLLHESTFYCTGVSVIMSTPVADTNPHPLVLQCQKSFHCASTLHHSTGSGPIPINQFLGNHFIECLNISFFSIKQTCDCLFILMSYYHTHY